LAQHTKDTTTVVPQLINDRNETRRGHPAANEITANENYQQMAHKLAQHTSVLAAMRTEIEHERITINAQFLDEGRSADYTNVRRQQGGRVKRAFFAVGEYLADKPAIVRYTVKAGLLTGIVATLAFTPARRISLAYGTASAAYMG